MIQTEGSTAFSKDAGISVLIIASALGSVLFFNSERISPAVNPAVAFAFYMTMWMDSGSEFLKYIWIHMTFPIVGGLIALVFYEFVYKKTQNLVDAEFEERSSKREAMMGR